MVISAGLRRKEEGVSFPFPAVETAGYYQSSPAGLGLARADGENALMRHRGRQILGILPLTLAPFGRAASVRMTRGLNRIDTDGRFSGAKAHFHC
jgi:hypothetical protein